MLQCCKTLALPCTPNISNYWRAPVCPVLSMTCLGNLPKWTDLSENLRSKVPTPNPKAIVCVLVSRISIPLFIPVPSFVHHLSYLIWLDHSTQSFILNLSVKRSESNWSINPSWRNMYLPGWAVDVCLSKSCSSNKVRNGGDLKPKSFFSMCKSTRIPSLVGLIDVDCLFQGCLYIFLTEITTARLAIFVRSSNMIIRNLQACGLWNPLEGVAQTNLDLLSPLLKRM